jgi:hypothetical protein
MGYKVDGARPSGVQQTNNNLQKGATVPTSKSVAPSATVGNAGAASKLGETKFSGKMMAYKVAAAQPPQGRGPITPTVANGLSTQNGTNAKYTVGAAQRPPIQHDNGFLQNPKNDNDPTPIATKPPTQKDKDDYGRQKTLTNLGLVYQDLNPIEKKAIDLGSGLIPGGMKDQYEKYKGKDLKDGLQAYDHFLTGNGKDRTFSYDKFVKDDPSGKTILANGTRDIQKSAEDIYNQMIAKDPSLKGKEITFKITGSQIGVSGKNANFPYPKTENWQKAIGAHQVWMSADITVKPNANGKPDFSAKMTLHAEDRFNFNPGMTDIATGTPDAVNGRFETVGLAKQYMNYATLQRDVKWSQGNGEQSVQNMLNGKTR